MKPETPSFVIELLAPAIVLLAAIILGGNAPRAFAQEIADAPPPVLDPTDQRILLAEETYLQNVRQLTTGHSPGADPALPPANFAEAYWAPDGNSLILQATVDGLGCDQVFQLDLITGARSMVSSGLGRVTCAYYTADNAHFIYSSTHEHDASCPARPDMSMGYVWPLYDSYDIYLADLASGEVLRNITDSPGYDAEGTIDWVHGWLYFTSTRDGDIDIYRQHLESGVVERLTDEFGYDGGPFINYSGDKVVYRRSVLDSEEERADYTALLEQGLIRPGQLELMVMDADGSNKRQLTSNGAANFAPYLHPDGETLIFCSNLHNPEGFDFDLYVININGGEPERVTFDPNFDGFPMFSPDGTKLVWCANRNGSHPRETNVFVADWVR